jgi:hypothetical protein
LRPRDLIVVGAVVLVAGFAAADALRGRADETVVAPTTEGQTGPTRLPAPEPPLEAPPDWPVGALEGELVFTAVDGCRVRAVDLSSGRERELASFSGTCELWAAPTGQQVAYGLGPSSGDGFVPFKLADLAAPERELGGYRALFGVVLWSQDGQRVAWCGTRRVGFDLEVGGPARRLPSCPAAYTPDNGIAFAIGRRLVVEDKTVLRADAGITFARFGTDESLAVVEDGRELVRYSPDGRHRDIIGIPEGRTPILSPDNCAAVFRPLEGSGGITFTALPCFQGRAPVDLVGNDAAWSPDGEWLAVAEEDAIALERVVGPAQTVRWPARAAELAWRRG